MILLENEHIIIEGTEDVEAKVVITFKRLKQELTWYEARDLYAKLNEWLMDYAHIAGSFPK